MRTRIQVPIMIAFAGMLLLGASSAKAQADSNFPNRQAVIINNAPSYLTLSAFSFENRYYNSSTRLMTNLRWANTGNKPITAFEVVVKYYDPFNRPMLDGGRWLVTGHDSANWSPLQPGESDGDGLIGFRHEEAYTAVVYVRAIRFEDNTVWTSNQPEVEQKIRAAVPDLKEIGPLDPGPKSAEKP